MNIINCLICEGELDIIKEEGYRKFVKCRKCGFANIDEKVKEPEVFIIKRK
jgi:hypothetical protein